MLPCVFRPCWTFTIRGSSRYAQSNFQANCLLPRPNRSRAATALSLYHFSSPVAGTTHVNFQDRFLPLHFQANGTRRRRYFWGAHLSWKPGGCPGRSVALGIAARHVMMPDCRQRHSQDHIGRTSSWTAVGFQDRFLPLHLQATIHSYQCPRAFRGSGIAARSSINVISL
jgi:hypothetical protein